MEFFSGCFALLFGGPLLIVFIRYNQLQRLKGHEQFLGSLLQEFMLSGNRSEAQVAKIHHVLMTYFAQETQFEGLMAATGSFIPSGKPPFLDEGALAQKFAEFLATRYQVYLDPGQNVEGVWPPPPQRSLSKD